MEPSNVTVNMKSQNCCLKPEYNKLKSHKCNDQNSGNNNKTGRLF